MLLRGLGSHHAVYEDGRGFKPQYLIRRSVPENVSLYFEKNFFEKNIISVMTIPAFWQGSKKFHRLGNVLAKCVKIQMEIKRILHFGKFDFSGGLLDLVY